MSVIIRLQNLPWAANAADIRQYFQGLSIPEGGVHIVGGEKGDAFISFSTDEDARQAMLSDCGCIKDVQIRLLLSSRNEMQKVIETARQQAMQLSQVYMQQMQPQIPIVGSLPPLTAKVLPQPQQQQVRPDRMIGLMHRTEQPVMVDPAAMLMSHEKQQIMQHLSPKLLDNKDRDDKGYKRERTRSKSRDRKSKSSRGSGGRRDRSRSRDRRRRDRSRGRDRSRDRHHENSRNSSSRSSGGGKSHRSRSPGFRGGSADGGRTVGDQQPQSVTAPRSYPYQYDGAQQQQQPQAAINLGGTGPMFSQFRTPPQPPIIHQNAYQPQSQKPPAAGEWGGPATQARVDDRQPPYVPSDGYRGSDMYDEGDSDDDEDDRRRPSGYGNAHQRRYNDGAAGAPAARRGGPLSGQQDYRGGDQQQQQLQQQHGFGGGGSRGPRFQKPHQQPPAPGPMQNRGSRPYGDFVQGGGPRFNGQQQQSRYRAGAGDGAPDGGGGRQSRFSSVHEGGRPSRFNPAPAQQQDGGSVDFDESAGNRHPPQPQRFNDRFRYDVRNTPKSAATPAAPLEKCDGLCVEVNNMSNHFSYGDVRKLFDGIHIDGSAIKIQKHRQGVVFVRFDSNHNKNLAMRMTGTAYKGSHVVVKHLDDGAYERENTDDRPYPSTTVGASVPVVVDHVDLVDEDDEIEPQKPSVTDLGGGKSQNPDDRSDDGGNLVVCEKGSAKEDGGGGAPQPSSELSVDPPTKYLKLKQLPITVSEDDVLNEFDGGGEVRRVTFYPDGEFLGAALEFRSVDVAEATLKKFDCVLLGSTPVPVLRCSYKEYAQIKRKAGVGSGGGGGGGSGSKRFSGDGGGRHQHHHHHQQQVHNPPTQSMQQPNMSVPPAVRGSNCLYLYGLPTTVTNTDITQFFSDISVLPDKIHIMLSKFGRPTGESYCEFGTAQQAHAALAKDQCYMGPSLVYVEPISRSDMIQAITKPMQQRNHPQQDMSWTGGGMRGGPPRQPQHNNAMMQSSPRHQGPGSSYGGGGGGGHNGAYGGGGGGSRFMNSGGGRGGGNYAPRMRGPPGPGPNAGPNTGPDGFGQPGCVVALDNVPYRADVQEIVDFFEGFELNCQNVIRRFNDFGKPTGEARVNLRNPQEAMRAVRVLQNKPIYNRPVCLTLL